MRLKKIGDRYFALIFADEIEIQGNLNRSAEDEIKRFMAYAKAQGMEGISFYEESRKIGGGHMQKQYTWEFGVVFPDQLIRRLEEILKDWFLEGEAKDK